MLIGFRSTNHRQQVGKRGALDRVDDRRTPRDLWDPLHATHRFTLDAAASHENALCPSYFTAEDNGLEQSWVGHRVWCNPPFSDCRAWVDKAWLEMYVGCELIVMLLPGNRTEQPWWQDAVERFRDSPDTWATVGGRTVGLRTRFLAGRLRFDVPVGTYSDPRGNRPPFGCVLLIWSAPSQLSLLGGEQ